MECWELPPIIGLPFRVLRYSSIPIFHSSNSSMIPSFHCSIVPTFQQYEKEQNMTAQIAPLTERAAWKAPEGSWQIDSRVSSIDSRAVQDNPRDIQSGAPRCTLSLQSAERDSRR